MIDLPRGSSLPALSGGQEAELTSLPLQDDLEKRRRLAEERKREYNEFLARKQREEELKRLARKSRERKNSHRKDAHAPGTNEKAVQAVDSDSATNGKVEKAPRRGLSEDDLAQVSILKQETDRLRAEREEFAKLISSLREVVLTAKRKSSSRSEQRLDQRDRRPEARRSADVDQDWERNQSLDRSLKGRRKRDEGHRRDSDGGLTSSQLEKSPPDVDNAGMEDARGRRGLRGHVSVKEQYIRDLEAQIRETRERRLMEKEEEARLDEKCKMERYEPWDRPEAPGKEPGRKPRFIGELVHPVETSSSIIPTKARSESSLAPRFCPELALPGSLRRHFFPHDFGGRRARPAKSTVTVESYRDELRQQIEDRKRRTEEQKQRDRSEEEKLLRRIDEQRQRMFQEYQEEQERKHKKDEEVRKKQERLVKLQRDKSKDLQQRSKSRADGKEKRKSSKVLAKSSSSENGAMERQSDVNEAQTEVKTFHPSSQQRRQRSESRDRLVNNVEILRRQLATEQQISRIQQLQKNYVVTDLRRKADSDDWILPP